MKKMIISLIMVLILFSCGQKSIIGQWNPEGLDIEDVLLEFTKEDMIILGVPIPYTLEGNTIVISDGELDERIDFTFEEDVLILLADGLEQRYIKVE